MNESTNLAQLNEDILYEKLSPRPKLFVLFSIVIHFLCIKMIIGSFAKERNGFHCDSNEPYITKGGRYRL